VFVQLLHEAAGEHRGSTQAGSINWVMGMARRTVGAGRVGIRTMVSLEPVTIPGCGYPDLLATGEFCDGESIHDRQHPHDLFMELAADYERVLRGALRWQVYAGLAGEPALGPAAFPHRLSAMPNPVAPTGHHWLDATHITYGVVTAGVFTPRWKAEASIFNGREPDENRWDLDLAALDSLSGRFSFAPSPALVLQVSAGHLTEAEAAHDAAPRVDVDRVTASATFHRNLSAASVWATTFGWGRNAEGGEATHSVLLESNITLRDRHTWYGRVEVGGKPAHDLHVHESDDVFTVGKLQGGYTHYLPTRRGFNVGFGGELSAALVPEYLEPRYGSRANMGFGLFITVRPAAMVMRTMAPSAAAPAAPAAPAPALAPASTMKAAPQPSPATVSPSNAGEPKLPVIAAERVVDPACAARLNLADAPRATYQGRVYYFCSVADRDEFMKDPGAYLKKRGQ
jgi:YHS domain-containing protein